MEEADEKRFSRPWTPISLGQLFKSHCGPTNPRLVTRAEHLGARLDHPLSSDQAGVIKLEHRCTYGDDKPDRSKLVSSFLCIRTKICPRVASCNGVDTRRATLPNQYQKRRDPPAD